MGELADRFGVEAPVRPTQPRPVRSATPALVEAAAVRAGAQEATWERLRPAIGRRRDVPTVILLSPGDRTSGVRLSLSACAAAFGEPRSRRRVHLEGNRLAHRLAIVADDDGDYKLHVGHVGGASLARLVADLGLPPGRYRARCTPGRVEIAAGDVLP